MDRVKRICYLSPMRAAKVQTSLRIRAVSPEPSLLAHTSNESRGAFRQKARSLAPLNGWASAVKICHDRMLEDTNSLDGAHIVNPSYSILWMITAIFSRVWIFTVSLRITGTDRQKFCSFFVWLFVLGFYAVATLFQSHNSGQLS